MPGIDTFIDRYLFPGGYLPTINQLVTSIHAGSKATLEVETVQNIGPHYIRTLQCWRENFEKNQDVIRANFVEKHKDATEADIEAFCRTWLVSQLLNLVLHSLPVQRPTYDGPFF